MINEDVLREKLIGLEVMLAEELYFGDVLSNAEAIAFFEPALQEYETLSEIHPDRHDKMLASAAFNLANVLLAQGLLDEAEGRYEQSLPLRERLYETNPTVSAYANDLAATHYNYGLLLRFSEQFDEAETVLRKAHALWENLYEEDPDLCADDLSNVLYILGNMLEEQRRFAEAAEMYQRTLTIQKRFYKENPDEYAETLSSTLINLGNIFFYLNRHNESEGYYRRALTLREELFAADSEMYASGLANTLCNLANTLNEQNRFAEAEAAYRRALELRQILYNADPADYAAVLVSTLSNLGLTLATQHRLDQAEDFFRRGLELYETHYGTNPNRHTDHLARILNNLGNVLEGQRRFSEAQTIYQKALVQYETLHRQEPAIYAFELSTVLSNLGDVLDYQDQHTEAEAAYHRALELLEALYEAKPEAYGNALLRTLSNLGGTLIEQHRYGEAETTYRRVFTEREALYKAHPEIYSDDLASTLNNLGGAVAKQRRYSEAEALYRRALSLRKALYENNPEVYANDLAMVLVGLASVLEDQHREDEAESAFRRAVALDPLCRLPFAWQARLGLGERMRRKKQYQQAYTLWADVLNAVERYRGREIPLEADRTHLLGNFSHLYPRVVKTCLQIDEQALAWHWAERGKNRALLDRMGRATPVLSEDVQADYDAWDNIQHTMRLLEENLRASQPKDKAQSSQNDIGRQLRATQEQETSMRQDVLTALGPAAQYIQVSVPDSATLAEHLRALSHGQKTLLVEYTMLDDDHYVVFLLPLWQIDDHSELPLHVEEVQLKSRSVARLTRHFSQALNATRALPRIRRDPAQQDNLAGPETSSSAGNHPEARWAVVADAFEALPALIGEAFIAPWARTLHRYGAEALLIVPSGPLHQLPLHLGLLQPRRRNVPAQPLIDTYQIGYLASASLAAMLHDRRIDEPVVSSQTAARQRLVLGPPQGDLPAAQREAEYLAKRWGTQPYMFDHMQKAVLRQQAGQLDVVHLVTHSRFDENDYLKSNLQFHGSEVLTLAELYTEPAYDLSDLCLFYLSSCESGRAGRLGSEELQGLAWALAARGAQAVLGSLWPVSDRAGEFMAAGFYKRLEEGLTLGKALQATVLEMREIEDFSNPYYWAPFVLYGNHILHLPQNAFKNLPKDEL